MPMQRAQQQRQARNRNTQCRSLHTRLRGAQAELTPKARRYRRPVFMPMPSPLRMHAGRTPLLLDCLEPLGYLTGLRR